MEIIVIITLILSIGGLLFVIYDLLGTIKELTKIIKATNLQEYIMEEGKPETNKLVEVGQKEDRYIDISEINNEQIRNIKMNPNDIHKGLVEKVENFN